jgi:hypothetical protein
MSRRHHPAFQDYPIWNVERSAEYEASRAAWAKSLPTYEDKKAQDEAEYAQRRLDYEAWCRTSQEWRALSKLVAWRSRGHCESCLAAPAQVIHHLTYEFGKLPPAWYLRAVCDDCHERLHTAGDDWCDYGMAKIER